MSNEEKSFFLLNQIPIEAKPFLRYFFIKWHQFMSMDNSVTSYESILDYWFGGDQQLNYKCKWFPSAHDGVQQSTDVEINSKFLQTFESAIKTGLEDRRHEWLLSEKSGNYRSHLAYIVLVDQFSRHIYRLQEVGTEDDRRVFADKQAVHATDLLIEHDNHWWHHYSPTEVVFALMPYRHSPTIARLEYISSVLDQKEAHEKESLELMNKFRKQTITRLQRLQDRQKVCKKIACCRFITKLINKFHHVGDRS